MKYRSVTDIIQNQTIISTHRDVTVKEAVDKMNKNNIGAILILDETGCLEGIFTERDVLTRVVGKGLDPSVIKIQDVMTKKPLSVPEDYPLAHALLRIVDSGIRHMPVTSGSRVVGMISMRDAMSTDLAALEETLRLKDALSEVVGFGG